MSALCLIKNITGPDKFREDIVRFAPAGELYGVPFPATVFFLNGDCRDSYLEVEAQDLIDGLVELGLVEPKQGNSNV